MDFAVPVNHRVKNQKKRNERQIFRSCQRTEEAVEHEGDSDTSCEWRFWNVPQRLGKWTRRIGYLRTNRGYPDYSILKIG